MYDLHSNSGAIKLNQTGGMLKHLRTGSGTIDICTVDWDHSKEAWSLREVWLQVLHGVGSQSAAGAIFKLLLSDPVPLFLVYTAFYCSDPVPSFLVQDHFSYK